MLDELKKQVYLKKTDLMFDKGVITNKIVPFDQEIYEQMSHTYFNGLPISMHMKYLKPLDIMPGVCYDRSLLMFFCFENSVLVRGNNKDLEMKFGKENENHGWLEMDNYVYDPSLLMRFDKDLYYKMYRPENIDRYTKEQYCSFSTETKQLYDSVKKTTIEDLKYNEKIRKKLNIFYFLYKINAKVSKNEMFIKELNEFLSLIQYDKLDYMKESNLKAAKI